MILLPLHSDIILAENIEKEKIFQELESFWSKKKFFVMEAPFYMNMLSEWTGVISFWPNRISATI